MKKKEWLNCEWDHISKKRKRIGFELGRGNDKREDGWKRLVDKDKDQSSYQKSRRENAQIHYDEQFESARSVVTGRAKWGYGTTVFFWWVYKYGYLLTEVICNSRCVDDKKKIGKKKEKKVERNNCVERRIMEDRQKERQRKDRTEEIKRQKRKKRR